VFKHSVLSLFVSFISEKLLSAKFNFLVAFRSRFALAAVT